MIKHLSQNFLNNVLKLFNRIFIQNAFSAASDDAIVIPFLKSGKHDKISPPALSSCLCKVLEKMVNDNLFFYFILFYKKEILLVHGRMDSDVVVQLLIIF